MYQSHAGHAEAPGNHDGGYEDTRTKAFEKNVGDGFCQSIGDEENGESGIVLAGGDVQALLQAVQFCIPNVCSIEEADQVEKTEPRNEPEIQLPQERSILSVANWVRYGGLIRDDCQYIQCALSLPHSVLHLGLAPRPGRSLYEQLDLSY